MSQSVLNSLTNQRTHLKGHAESVWNSGKKTKKLSWATFMEKKDQTYFWVKIQKASNVPIIIIPSGPKSYVLVSPFPHVGTTAEHKIL